MFVSRCMIMYLSLWVFGTLQNYFPFPFFLQTSAFVVFTALLNCKLYLRTTSTHVCKIRNLISSDINAHRWFSRKFLKWGKNVMENNLVHRTFFKHWIQKHKIYKSCIRIWMSSSNTSIHHNCLSWVIFFVFIAVFLGEKSKLCGGQECMNSLADEQHKCLTKTSFPLWVFFTKWIVNGEFGREFYEILFDFHEKKNNT